MSRIAEAAILLIINLATPSALSAQTVLKENAVAKVYVAWDDNRILSAPTKASRDRLSLALARATSQLVEMKDWPEVKIDKATDARTLVDRYFDYYPRNFPRTSEFLAQQIKELNGAKLNKSGMIKIPPVPVKPYEISESAPTQLRTFSPGDSQYRIVPSLTQIEIPDVFRTPIPAKKLETIRERGATVVSFDSLDAFRKIFTADIRKQLGRSLYVWVGGLEDGDTSTFPWLPVEFYEDPQPCVPTPPASTSSYVAAWNARRASLSDAVLKERADSSRLVLVDWDFKNGHGLKVFEVVQLALRHFGVWDLLSPYVEQFELNPKINGAKLKNVLAAYRATTPPAIQEQLKKSEHWIEDYIPREGSEQDFDQGILQAIIWEHFSNRQTWVNLSFSVRNKNVDYYSSMENSAAYSFVAAGNKPEELPPYFFPQNIAWNYHGHSVNVTYGDRDGTVRGTFAAKNPDYETSVALLAQGSNFRGCSISATDAGSSFASPWVAASAWLKHLVDQVPNTDMRRTLIQASEPIPTMSATVDSGGYFDPDLLLGFASKGPAGHAVRRDGTVELLEHVELDYRVTNKNGSISSETLKLQSKPTFAVTLAKCSAPFSQDSTCLWTREDDEPAKWPLLVDTFKLRITPVGKPASELTAKDFLDQYASIHF
jgi:hypothetical protein